MQAIKQTDFSLPGQKSFYRGKVRDVYGLEDNRLVIVASDRISAFDHILPRAIPFKGQVLNSVAIFWLNETSDIVPNWMEQVPDPNVCLGKHCEPFQIEMVIRGYLAGHAWREYKAGKRTLCGVEMPDGLKQSDKFAEPIITPATKAEEGHDEDISAKDIVAKHYATHEEWEELCKYTRSLFAKGTEIASERGLILVDTKYEFGKDENGRIILIDEIHTPDSSRYFYNEGYDERQANGTKQKQLSKEFVREWLIENDFQGLEGQKMPEMSDEVVEMISNRYLELYKVLIGKDLEKRITNDPLKQIENNIFAALKEYKRTR